MQVAPVLVGPRQRLLRMDGEFHVHQLRAEKTESKLAQDSDP